MIPLPPSLKLPPWDADAKVMTHWVNTILDAIGEDAVRRAQTLKTPSGEYWIKEYYENWGEEIHEAEHGNIRPLRLRLVSLGRTDTERAVLRHVVDRWVQLETLPHGIQWTRDRPLQEEVPVLMAVECAHQIRELWKKYYPEHKRRSRDLVSAVDIAAEWCRANSRKVGYKFERIPAKPAEGSYFYNARMHFRDALSRLPPLARAK